MPEPGGGVRTAGKAMLWVERLRTPAKGEDEGDCYKEREHPRGGGTGKENTRAQVAQGKRTPSGRWHMERGHGRGGGVGKGNTLAEVAHGKRTPARR